MGAQQLRPAVKISIADTLASLIHAGRRGGAAGAVAQRPEPDARRVRLVADPLRSPITPLERFAVQTLTREGAMVFDALVERLARLLYRDALRHGAWVVDLGFFGGNLFVRDVARDLVAGAGVLWEIETPSRAR